MDALLSSKRTNDGWVGCYRVQIPLDNLNLEDKPRFPKLLAFEEQVEILATMLERYGVIHQTYDLFIGYPEHDQSVLDRFAEGCLRIKNDLSKLSANYDLTSTSLIWLYCLGRKILKLYGICWPSTSTRIRRSSQSFSPPSTPDTSPTTRFLIGGWN